MKQPFFYCSSGMLERGCCGPLAVLACKHVWFLEVHVVVLWLISLILFVPNAGQRNVVGAIVNSVVGDGLWLLHELTK